MTSPAGKYENYKRVDIETASQGKLVVMLFNGAIQRAEEARRLIETDPMHNIEPIHKNLIRAQEIIGELRRALDMKYEISTHLDRLYEYCVYLLIQANLKKETRFIDEALEHLVALRDTWKEAFEKVEREKPATSAPPKIDPHGATVMNLQG